MGENDRLSAMSIQFDFFFSAFDAFQSLCLVSYLDSKFFSYCSIQVVMTLHFLHGVLVCFQCLGIPSSNALASSRWGLFVSSTAFAYPFNASAYCTFVAYPAVNRLLIASSDSLFPILADIKKCFTAKWQFPALYSTTPGPCLLSASHFTAACCQC